MIHEDSTEFLSAEDEDQDLWLFLNHTRDVIFRAREKELQRYHISPEQASLLFVVQALENRATEAAISKHTIRSASTVSTLIRRMIKRGLIQKVEDPERKYLVTVAITREGLEAYQLSTKRGPIHRIMGELSQGEKAKFRALLTILFTKARQETGMDQDQLPS
jgi:DNA-binding MarR family transcriptional regulator